MLFREGFSELHADNRRCSDRVDRFHSAPGATGLLVVTLELFDTNNNEFDIKLSGEATISEPLTLALFGFALGGLAFARRLRL